MCGIVAYVGPLEAQPVLLEGLKRLEYRGYDSSGLAIFNGQGLKIAKKKGRIAVLEHEVDRKPLKGHLGISHTRWATHGEPSDPNAHPHTDQSGKLALVHNGVIENYAKIKKVLLASGHKFTSDTDTEVLTHLIGEIYDKMPADTKDRLEKAVIEGLKKVQGTFGIAVIHADHPKTIVGARRGSPLVLGIGRNEFFLASDVTAIVAHTQRVVYLNENDIVTIENDDFRIGSLTKEHAAFEISEVDFRPTDSELGDYPHYMLKEIFEQPQAIENAFRGRLNHEEATAKLGGLNMSLQELREIDRILVLGCGTALHSGIVGEYLIESLAQIPVETDFSSEFRYRNCPLDKRTLVFVVSQSGETADTLGALREAKRKGYRVLGICNNVASTIGRESDGGVYMHAGPEIGVAATKSFTSQVTIFALLSLLFGRMRFLSAAQGRTMVEEIERLPGLISKVLDQSEHIKKVAEKYAKSQSMLFFGRQYNYGVALEGALKMKEISYIHAEGYPSAELKHGIIAMIDETVPSILICPQDAVHDKNLSTLQEIKARKGKIIAIATEGDTATKELANDTIFIPDAPEYLVPILSVIPLQLLSYYTAVALNRDVDKPRNLAKSVTVE